MALQVLLRNSFLFIFLVLSHCNPALPEQKLQSLHKKGLNVETKGGITRVDNAVYSGTLYTLDAQGKDTVEIQNYLNGKEHGIWKQFYENGQLRESRFFKEGKKEGQYLAWWPDGSPQKEYYFENGEYEGTCKEWYQNGQLFREFNYHIGQEEGSQKMWKGDGKIESNYEIREGRRFGLLGTKNCTSAWEK